MKQRTLLASQDDMLARLVHNLNYGDGVVILSGDTGSGRSTVALSVFEQLDTYNQAFVVCPQQATLSELRRKIVPQFFINPLYSEEDEISETVVRLANGNTHSMLLVLDDADHLEKSTLDELLKLSHLQAHGIRFRIILVVKYEGLMDFRSQISQKYHAMMLPFNIQPLSLKERQELYCRLIECTEPKPKLSMDLVVRFLSRQSGKPEEIVKLVQQALYNPDALEYPNSALRFKLVIGFFLLISCLAGAWIVSENINLDITEKVFQARKKIKFSPDYDSSIPQKVVMTSKPSRISVAGEILADKHTKVIYGDSQIDTILEKNAESAPEKQVVIDTSQLEEIEVVKRSSHQSGVVHELTEQLFAIQPDKSLIPTMGYTIQIASVKHISSLSKAWHLTEGQKDLFLFRRKSGYVLLLGQFASREEASYKVRQFRFEHEVWIRQWSNIPTNNMQRLVINDAI